ncbi:carbohydrate ABC transporter permease [Aeromicrobium sp. UC242_57]|uniref:carbohydrate ABC transporter permease n=1 Tax=Aeromicrobium sp. UC242_57 TaxID=3374624 RepID=UPI0037B06303
MDATAYPVIGPDSVAPIRGVSLAVPQQAPHPELSYDAMGCLTAPEQARSSRRRNPSSPLGRSRPVQQCRRRRTGSRCCGAIDATWRPVSDVSRRPDARSVPDRRRGRRRRDIAMRGWRWLAPAVVVLLAVTAWPIGRAVWLSLSTYPLTNPDDRAFVGADNYVDVLTSRSWWIAVAATLAIVIVLVVVQLLLGFVFAAALRRLTGLWPVTRFLVLVPFAMLAVVSAVLWRDAVTTGYIATWFEIDDLGPWGRWPPSR